MKFRPKVLESFASQDRSAMLAKRRVLRSRYWKNQGIEVRSGVRRVRAFGATVELHVLVARTCFVQMTRTEAARREEGRVIE
jgi:hypothetical protein